MARLLLVRHAPTPETGSKLTGRLPGVSLGADGRTEAAATAERLSTEKIWAIYTSPIERTAETAAIIGGALGKEPVIHAGLIEVDYGSWSGRSLAQLRRTKLWRLVQATPSRVTFPNGEALADAQRRAVSACEEIAAAAGRRTAVLVSHADIIKAILSSYLGQPLDLFQRISVAPGSISVVHVSNDNPPVVSAVNTRGSYL